MIADALKAATVPGVVVLIDPMLVGTELAGRIVGVSGRQWRRWASEGLVPDPLRLGRRRLWLVEELRSWTAAGCPCADRWNHVKEIPLAPSHGAKGGITDNRENRTLRTSRRQASDKPSPEVAPAGR